MVNAQGIADATAAHLRENDGRPNIARDEKYPYKTLVERLAAPVKDFKLGRQGLTLASSGSSGYLSVPEEAFENLVEAHSSLARVRAFLKNPVEHLSLFLPSSMASPNKTNLPEDLVDEGLIARSLDMVESAAGVSARSLNLPNIIDRLCDLSGRVNRDRLLDYTLDNSMIPTYSKAMARRQERMAMSQFSNRASRNEVVDTICQLGDAMTGEQRLVFDSALDLALGHEIKKRWDEDESVKPKPSLYRRFANLLQQ